MGSPFGFMGFLGIAEFDWRDRGGHVIVLFDFIEGDAREEAKPFEQAIKDSNT